MDQSNNETKTNNAQVYPLNAGIDIGNNQVKDPPPNTEIDKLPKNLCKELHIHASNWWTHYNSMAGKPGYEHREDWLCDEEWFDGGPDNPCVCRQYLV